MVRNTLMDLNNHLFEQMERLNSDDLSDEGLTKEIQRAKSMSEVSGKIIENARLALNAEELKAEYGRDKPTLPKIMAW